MSSWKARPTSGYGLVFFLWFIGLFFLGGFLFKALIENVFLSFLHLIVSLFLAGYITVYIQEVNSNERNNNKETLLDKLQKYWLIPVVIFIISRWIELSNR